MKSRTSGPTNFAIAPTTRPASSRASASLASRQPAGSSMKWTSAPISSGVTRGRISVSTTSSAASPASSEASRETGMLPRSSASAMRLSVGSSVLLRRRTLRPRLVAPCYQAASVSSAFGSSISPRCAIASTCLTICFARLVDLDRRRRRRIGEFALDQTARARRHRRQHRLAEFRVGSAQRQHDDVRSRSCRTATRGRAGSGA